jgi:drug/metabolite transporter (DMT)-like permease
LNPDRDPGLGVEAAPPAATTAALSGPVVDLLPDPQVLAGQTAAEAAVQRRETLALAISLVLVFVWGVNFVIQKAVFEVLSPTAFLFARYLIMPVCAIAILVHAYGLRFPRVSAAEAWALARLGFVGHALHVGLVTYGIDWSTPFSSSVILACGPIFTLLILRWVGLETLTRAQIVGVALALAGVIVFLSDKLMVGRFQATGGDLVLLVAASLFSWYTVAAKPLIQRHGGIIVMGYATLFGSVPIVLATAPIGLAVDWPGVPSLTWAGLLWAVVISSFAGWLVWGWVNAVRGVARTAPLMYLMPAVAGLVSWVVADERFSMVKLAGAALTLAGVAAAQFYGNAGKARLRKDG